MLNVTQGVATVMVGLFIVGSQSLDVPWNSLGRATAIYDSARGVPVGSCDSLAVGGVAAPCDASDDHVQTKGNQAPSAMPRDSSWLNTLVMGPDPGEKAGKESQHRARGDSTKPTPNPSPKPGQRPGEKESRQKRSENAWLPEDCDAQPSTVRTHCLVYVSLHAS